MRKHSKVLILGCFCEFLYHLNGGNYPKVNSNCIFIQYMCINVIKNINKYHHHWHQNSALHQVTLTQKTKIFYPIYYIFKSFLLSLLHTLFPTKYTIIHLILSSLE